MRTCMMSMLEIAITKEKHMSNKFLQKTPSHVVVDIDLLDADVCEGHGEAKSAGPEALWEGCQRKAIAQNHEALNNKYCCQNIPHVDHLFLNCISAAAATRQENVQAIDGSQMNKNV